MSDLPLFEPVDASEDAESAVIYVAVVSQIYNDRDDCNYSRSRIEEVLLLEGDSPEEVADQVAAHRISAQRSRDQHQDRYGQASDGYYTYDVDALYVVQKTAEPSRFEALVLASPLWARYEAERAEVKAAKEARLREAAAKRAEAEHKKEFEQYLALREKFEPEART